jgi:hypothetical protein
MGPSTHPSRMMPPANPSTQFESKVPSRSRPHLLYGLRFLYWLLFKPSCWRTHVASLDSSLSPNFTLFDAKLARPRNSGMLETIALSFMAVTVWVAAVVSLVLGVTMQPFENLVFGAALGMGVGLASAVVADFTIGVAAGIVGGFVGGVAGGIGYGLTGVESLVGIFAHGTPAIVFLGLASCLGLASTGVIVDALTMQSQHRSWGHSVGILMFSILCDAAYALLFFAAYQLTGGAVRGVAFGALIVSMVGTGFGILVGFLNRNWQPGAILGIVFMIVVAAAVTSVNKIEAHRRGASKSVPMGSAKGFSQADSIHELLLNAYRGAASGCADAMIICVVYALPYVPARFAAGPRHAARAGLLGAGGIYFIFSAFISESPLPIAAAVAVASSMLGLTVHFWRSILLYPIEATWNMFLLRFDERHLTNSPSLLRWNAAFWDEFQLFPQVGLEEHLVLEMDRRQDNARTAREDLLETGHIEAVRAAELEMEARHLQRCSDVTAIAIALQSLSTTQDEGPAGSILRHFRRISQDVRAALNQVGSGNRRLTLVMALEQIDKLVQELGDSHEALVQDSTWFPARFLKTLAHRHGVHDTEVAHRARFRPVAMSWLRIVAEQLRTEESVQKQEVLNPYVVGVPLGEHHELFVGRTHEARLIETHVLSRNKSPLLLYGQRRMGKTSLLLNLGKLFPSHIVPMLVDLQGPVGSSTSYGGFLYNIARAMVNSAKDRLAATISIPTRESLETDPNTAFDEWLDTVEDALSEKTAILEFDELEVLEREIAKGNFDAEEAMGMFRHIIQHRPKINILFCTSHSILELQELSTHLVNAQVVRVGYLTPGESRQLVERPVKDFILSYEPEASQRVLDVTSGHPALLQLLCYNVVTFKNDQDVDQRWTVSPRDVEAALATALAQAAPVFTNIQKDVGPLGTATLRSVAKCGMGATVTYEQLSSELCEDLRTTLALLMLRDLLVRVESGYRFRIEMIRRWFAEAAVDPN